MCYYICLSPGGGEGEPMYYVHLLSTMSVLVNVSFAFSHELPQHGLNRNFGSHGVKDFH